MNAQTCVAYILPAAAAVMMCLCIASAGEKPRGPDVEYLTSEETKKMNLPFSEAVRVGGTLYLSGMLGIEPGTMRLVPGGIEKETAQALENIRRVLERNGSSMDRVVKCTVMMADMAEWPRMNAVYVTYFKKHLPARSALGANGLALGARVEIECIATVGGKNN
jgi:2-iminobutanoate/2-iminopropanoate deaminase